MDSVRKLLRVPFIEKALSAFPKRPDSLPGKIVPGNYLYSKPSIRSKTIDGITMEFDLSNYVDHYIYFNFIDNSLDKLYSYAKPGTVVFDIGTNIGYVALKLAKEVGPTGKVYGFEPDVDNFKKAQHNISDLNPWAKNLIIDNSGFGDKKGQFKLYAVDEGNNGMNQIRNDLSEGTRYSVINIEVLDDYIAERKISPPGLMKIDTEGYEMNIIKGGVKTIKEHKPVLFIEIDENNLKLQNNSARELVSFIKELKYTIIHTGTGKEVLTSDDFTNCHFDGLCLPQ
jgi:FkbM family methyltransferase